MAEEKKEPKEEPVVSADDQAMPGDLPPVVRPEYPEDYPSEERIKEWKEKYGAIMEVPVGGKYYIYRGLMKEDQQTIREKIEAGASTEDLDDLSVKLCTLYPADLSKIKLGTLTYLNQAISRLSGFVPDDLPREL